MGGNAYRGGNASPASEANILTYPEAADIEVKGAGLEEAFLELTGAGSDESEEMR